MKKHGAAPNPTSNLLVGMQLYFGQLQDSEPRTPNLGTYSLEPLLARVPGNTPVLAAIQNGKVTAASPFPGPSRTSEPSMSRSAT